jgi:hypothetical protein
VENLSYDTRSEVNHVGTVKSFSPTSTLFTTRKRHCFATPPDGSHAAVAGNPDDVVMGYVAPNNT